MSEAVDTAHFPTGADDLDYRARELAALEEIKAAARGHVESWEGAPPVKELVLAFGVPPLVGVFLVRFVAGTEMWAVAGDLPAMCFETDEARTPSDALRLYCTIAEDWAETALAGGDMADCYPIPVEASRETAEALGELVGLLRKEIIPLA